MPTSLKMRYAAELRFVLSQLDNNDGGRSERIKRWQIAAKRTKIPYKTIVKIGYRESLEPTIENVEKLATYFRGPKSDTSTLPETASA